jgi:hypothetical protein
MTYKNPEKAKAYDPEKAKAYREANKEKINLQKKAYYQANKEKVNLQKKAYREANKEKISLHKKAYYQTNKEKIRLQRKAYFDANKQKIRAGQKAHYQANKEKKIASVLTYQRNKRKTDPTYRLTKSLRNRVRMALKGKSKSKSTMGLIGCTIDELWLHLEKQFQSGMTRENHGFGEVCWHVDHIKPCAAFDLSDPEQQKICFHYTNLQPLWQRDNFSKGAKFDGSLSVLRI